MKTNLKEDIEALYSKEVTRFGNSGKIDCLKEYIGKKCYFYSYKKIKVKTKNKGIKIESKIDIIHTKEVTKFGNGAKINATKNLIGEKVLVFILK